MTSKTVIGLNPSKSKTNRKMFAIKVEFQKRQ